MTYCCIGVLLLILGTNICLGQAPPTIAQALAKEGVGTSNDELRSALRSPNARIRGMAAVQLAENGDQSAIPLLIEALERERVLSVRLNMARALNAFGDPKGTDTMQQLCTDRSARNDLRLEAAKDVSSRGSESCFPATVQILFSTENPVERQAALDYIQHADKEAIHPYDSEALAEACRRALTDEVPSVRRSAAGRIVQYGLTQDLSSLGTAAERETDPETQAVLRDAERRVASSH